MMDSIQRAIDSISDNDVTFADIRSEERITTMLQVVNGSVRDLSQSGRAGTVVRALVGECWGQASTTEDSTPEILQSLVEEAIKSAKASAKYSRKEIDLSELKFDEKVIWQSVKENPATVSMDEKIDFTMALDKGLDVSDKIVKRTCAYMDSKMVYRLANSLGAGLEWDEIRSLAYVQCVAREGEKMQFDYDIISGLGGYELIRSLNPHEISGNCAQGAIDLLAAEKPPSGKLTVIMDGNIAGLIAHEVCGHASEADEVVKERSFLTGMVGKTIGTEQVTMVDDGTLPGKYGSFPYDAEGTPSSRTAIIDKGVFTGYMHTLETAVLMRVAPTGNGRSQDYNRRIFARMTNTYFDKGDWKEDDIISDTKDGLLVVKAMSGMEDVVGGGVQASALKGYVIKNGEKVQLVRSMTLAGKVLDILQTVDAVGDKLEFSAGSCGKGEEDFIPVSTGGPYMRGELIVGGG